MNTLQSLTKLIVVCQHHWLYSGKGNKSKRNVGLVLVNWSAINQELGVFANGIFATQDPSYAIGHLCHN